MKHTWGTKFVGGFAKADVAVAHCRFYSEYARRETVPPPLEVGHDLQQVPSAVERLCMQFGPTREGARRRPTGALARP